MRSFATEPVSSIANKFTFVGAGGGVTSTTKYGTKVGRLRFPAVSCIRTLTALVYTPSGMK